MPEHTAYQTVVNALTEGGFIAKVNGHRATARCPAHDDGNPSLAVAAGDGQALVFCHGGCQIGDVVAKLGLRLADLYDNPKGRQWRYDNGRTVFRTPDKKFRQEDTDQPPELYRLGKIKEAVAADLRIWICEGEKDVDEIVAHWGGAATCAPMGAGKWPKVDSSPLYGANWITVVVDKDEPGRRHAMDIRRDLAGKVGRLEFVQALEGKDVSDHIAAGHTQAELVPIDLEPVDAQEPSEPDPPEDWRNKPPTLIRLDEFLLTDDEPAKYRLDRLMPTNSHVLVAAQWKAGKSTMVGNLLRALADIEPFLGEFTVNPPAGGIVLFDDELDPGTLRTWLRAQHIRNTDRIHVVSLRGRLHYFNLLDPAVMDYWVQQIRQLPPTAMAILDCLRPVLDAIGLAESTEAGRFLVHFDELLHSAGVTETILIHHMGHQNDRARGDSRLLDWPDVNWRIIRQVTKEDDGTAIDDPNAPRYFSAFGRDVEVPEHLLHFDEQTKRLTYSTETRAHARTGQLLAEIVEFLTDAGPSSKNTIEKNIKGRSTDIRAAITDGLSSYRLVKVDVDGSKIALIGVPGHPPLPPRPTSSQEKDEPPSTLVPSLYRDEVDERRGAAPEAGTNRAGTNLALCACGRIAEPGTPTCWRCS